MNRPIPRIGVIGAGQFGQLHLEVLAEMTHRGGAQLVAFAARTSETVERQRAKFGIEGYTDWRSLLARTDLDAILVTLIEKGTGG